MINEANLIKMYEAVNGSYADSNCELQIDYDEYTGDSIGINLIEHGVVCSFTSTQDRILLFENLTK